MKKIFHLAVCFSMALAAGKGHADTQQFPRDEAAKMLTLLLDAFNEPSVLLDLPRNRLNNRTRHCLEYLCTNSLPENIEVKNKEGKILNHWAQGLYDAQFRPCSTSKGCQWMIWTAAKPFCQKYPCLPSFLELTASISWDPPYKLNKPEGPRSEFVYLRVPRDLFLKNQTRNGKSCQDRNPPHTFVGLGIDGEPLCLLDPVARQLESEVDHNPYRDQSRPDHPMLGFEVGDFPYAVDEGIRLKNLSAQVRIWAMSKASVYSSLVGCVGSGCAAGNRVIPMLAADTELADKNGRLNSVLLPCRGSEVCPWRVEIFLERPCRGADCLKDLPVKVVLWKSDKKVDEFRLHLQSAIPEQPAACAAGSVLRGFDSKGLPVCGKGG